MDFGKRVALLAALAILVAAAALGGTADRSAAESSRADATAKAGRLVAFGWCPDLLRYAKSQAARFVGPYGFGGPVTLDATAAAREGRRRRPPSRASTSPARTSRRRESTSPTS